MILPVSSLPLIRSDPAQALFPPPQHFDLPQFSNLSAALLDSTISSFLDSLRKRLRELEETEVDVCGYFRSLLLLTVKAEHDLSYFIHGLEDINNMVEKFFSPFSHLEGVKFSQERHEVLYCPYSDVKILNEGIHFCSHKGCCV